MSPLLLLLACGAPKAPPVPAAAAPPAPAVDAAPAEASSAPLETRRPFAPTLDGERLTVGVAYGPHREGQRPGGPDPSREQLAEDLRIIAEHWPMLRMYGSRGPTRDVLEIIAAEDLPLRVMVGAWIDDDDPAADAAELDAAVALAREFPEQVVALSIGNETQVDWSAHRSPPGPLIDKLRQVRAAVDQPVTTADDYSWWVLPESRAVAAEVDFLLVHAHPLWNGQQRQDGIAWLDATLDRVRETHPGVPLVLGEIGWATSHAPDQPEGELIRGVADEAEQAAFLAEYRTWVEGEEDGTGGALPWFWFEAFDEPWKGGDHPDEVEKHWGLFFEDRTPKPALQPPAGGQDG